MQAISFGKKSCLSFTRIHLPLLFNIFMCDLFIVLEEIDFASYADDNTHFVSEATPENVVSIRESCSASLFECFSNNQMKATLEYVIN